jgi:dihydrofolate synthase/folylpolyglutamate synthase
MTYQAALEFLYGLQKHGIKLGLEAITALLGRLDDPQLRFRSLHIGGTNGKGSTAAMAAAMLQQAGYRVGLYTSPHLLDFRERIRVDGMLITEEQVAALTDRLRDLDQDASTTFFEFTTAMAFEHFAETGVDLAVVEVGMGGRFDATNVLRPLVSTITNVALDHQEYLGRTVPAIAMEKAGIIKHGVPVVIGRLLPEALAVVRRLAAERRAPLYRLGADFHAEGDPVTGFRYDGLERRYVELSCPLPGQHQLDNAACAVAMLELASGAGIGIPEPALREGLRRVAWQGRLERVDQEPALVLDGGHNPAAASVVAAYLRRYRQQHPEARLILVVSMMRDKDRKGFLSTLVPLADEVILTQAQLPRAATVDELAASVPERSRPVHRRPIPSEAVRLARQLARREDIICITGSLMLVGEVKAMLQGCGLSPLRG